MFAVIGLMVWALVFVSIAAFSKSEVIAQTCGGSGLLAFFLALAFAAG